jgi:hypothetical protein
MSNLALFQNQLACLLPSTKNRPLAAELLGPAGSDEVAATLVAFAQAPVVHAVPKFKNAPSNAPSNVIPVFESRDDEGYTIMHRLVAIGPSASRAVACLASHRLCPLTVRSNSGQTPLDVAIAKGNRVCAAILDRAIEIRKCIPVERERCIREMAARVASSNGAGASEGVACASQSRDCSSQELVCAVRSLRDALDRSV